MQLDRARRRRSTGSVALVAALVVVVGLLALPASPVGAQEAEEPDYTFVSMPDFLNADIGDTRASSRWEPGDPNSINPSYQRALDVVLDQVEAEAPSSVLVAGDLVEGHWGVDVENTGLFGPTRTSRQKRRAVVRAGDLYYSQWQKRFAERGLTVFPAVGDHEIGDNPWRPWTFKYNAFNTFKRTWARHFTDFGATYPLRPLGTEWEDTAYATYLTPDILLVTVDVFQRIPGGVRATVTDGQLAWLDGLLASTSAEHVIVQGHTPVLGPVRRNHSSGLMLEGGANSPFWQTLRRHGVDVYLCGEVHEVTATDDGRVLQIAHGALITRGEGGYNYLVGRVYGDRLEFEIKRIPRTSLDRSALLWATSWKRPAIGVSYARASYSAGMAILDNDGTRFRGGELASWSG